ncbi:MAG: FecR family protein [Verrucomicrobiales bacterium]|nr:FecR family protein [Verrucomicrobiales bacterium]
MKSSPFCFFVSGALTCLLLTTLSYAEPESGTVTVAVGDVQVISGEGAAAVPLEKGDKVAVGSTVVTGDDSRAVVVITPRSAIRIAANSEVVLESIDEVATPSDILIDLKSGSLGALLKPEAATELDFKVRTPSGVAAARGTFYSVVVKDGKGFAQVKEGRVEIIPTEAEDGQ